MPDGTARVYDFQTLGGFPHAREPGVFTLDVTWRQKCGVTSLEPARHRRKFCQNVASLARVTFGSHVAKVASIADVASHVTLRDVALDHCSRGFREPCGVSGRGVRT